MIVKWWRAYIRWCDRMGLTEDNQRCCVPKLADPALKPKLSVPAETAGVAEDDEPH
jgi:hypothetical protein